uniref:Uncharacterized protein n=1 Tax=Picea sitchensis TaxID=3332 RepID=A9P2K2_PICSI|nr:unknown [Picea sitchensis]
MLRFFLEHMRNQTGVWMNSSSCWSRGLPLFQFSTMSGRLRFGGHRAKESMLDPCTTSKKKERMTLNRVTTPPLLKTGETLFRVLQT